MKTKLLNHNAKHLQGLFDRINQREDLASLHPDEQIELIKNVRGFSHGKKKKNKRRKR